MPMKFATWSNAPYWRSNSFPQFQYINYLMFELLLYCHWWLTAPWQGRFTTMESKAEKMDAYQFELLPFGSTSGEC
jgi:hypothetical protein